MMREAIAKLDRQANKRGISGTANVNGTHFLARFYAQLWAVYVFGKEGRLILKQWMVGAAGLEPATSCV